MATLWTNEARCRDCNRCVRVCPVKAVSKESSQARVMPERCILCGLCVRECPQHAKSYENHIHVVRKLLSTPRKQVIASMAPSYVGAIPPFFWRSLASVLRQMGFHKVTETAIGAEIVASATKEIISKNPTGKFITSACPAVVRYVARHRPQAMKAVVPVASPMVSHARYLKSLYGSDAAVVFIGPCLAKKDEAHTESMHSVDAVLTFEELMQMIAEYGLNPRKSEESEFDGPSSSRARLFPISGGFAHAAGLSTDHLSRSILSVSGADAVKQAIDYLLSTDEPIVLDPLMCDGGCLGGAGISQAERTLQRRHSFIKAVSLSLTEETVRQPVNLSDVHIETREAYEASPLPPDSVDESDIRKVLEATGKYGPEDELNCGACGYDTCREKALAVLKGRAEIQMCIPFMRHNAELKSDAIVQNSPNAIVIVDRELNIVHANARFLEMFMTGESCRGKHISYFMDSEPFEKVATREIDIYDEMVSHSAYGVTCQQLVYRVGSGDSDQVVGVLVNLTRSKRQEADLDLLRREALARAEEVIDRQVQIAQEVAKLLGKSAADTKTTLRRLTDLVKRDEVK